jgi:hypothetical protein
VSEKLAVQVYGWPRLFTAELVNRMSREHVFRQSAGQCGHTDRVLDHWPTPIFAAKIVLDPDMM